MTGGYSHTQRSPLCLVVYVLAVIFPVLAWLLRGVPPIPWIFPPVGVAMFVLAVSFHYLQVADDGDRLSIRFGPLPLFRRSVAYEQIASVEIDRTTVLDGWGIHMSARGGWVWNIWGRDCVLLRLHRSCLRIGTDDAEGLAGFLNTRLARQPPRSTA